MGTSLFKIEVVYDTGSSWVIVANNDCDSSCAGLTYDHTTSNAYIDPNSDLRT